MKDGVILVNTSRGGLIRTDDLIAGIREHKFFAVGLDVYEEETDFVFEDMSEMILPELHHPETALLPECSHDFPSGLLYQRGSDQYRRDYYGKCQGLYERRRTEKRSTVINYRTRQKDLS